jgi:AraC-like DNA-binding protein
MKSVVFHDIDHFNDFSKPWEREGRKLNKGNDFKAGINLLPGKDVSLAEISINGIVELKGGLSKGMRSFLIPGDDHQSFYWRNHIINGYQIGLYPLDSEMLAISNYGYNILVVSVPESIIRDKAAKMKFDLTTWNQDPRNDRIIPDHNMLQNLRQLIRQLFNLKKPSSTSDDSNFLFGELKNNLIDQLILTYNSSADRYRPDKSNRSRVFQKARDYIFSNPTRDFRMHNLCEYVASCERTLQYAVKSFTGLTPLEYVKAHKLNYVRDELLLGDPQDTKISEVALRYGFLHASQFALDYKQLFGELPSATLQK